MLLWYTKIIIIPLLLYCSLWLLDHVWILQEKSFFFKSWINENVLFTFIHSISPLRHIFYIFLKSVRFIVLCVLSFVCMFVYTYIGNYLCARQWMLYLNRIYQLPMEISLYSMYFEVIFFYTGETKIMISPPFAFNWRLFCSTALFAWKMFLFLTAPSDKIAFTSRIIDRITTLNASNFPVISSKYSIFILTI